MPMSQHRPALAAILVAVVAVLSAFVASSPVHAAPPTPNPIAERALKDLGTYQGECWTWMKQVVLDATGQTIGFDYRQGYFEAGAVEVSVSQATRGDIIQIADDSWTTPDADYSGLHTAIVLANNGDGTFDAIDSNQNFDGVVALRPNYDPAALSRARGLNFHIYRIASGAAATAPAAPALAAGEPARVNTPGDCLNLRSAPGGTVLRCLSHGSLVSITGPAKVVDGQSWSPVSTLAGTGWMATGFLTKEAPATASPSGSGTVKPVLGFHAFMSVASD
jgi:hypothetical protein